jgi:heterodisulfide reductase subunit D
MIAFSPTLQDTAAAFTEILDKVHENYLIMGPEEWCCGYPLHIAGYEEGLRELMDHNVKLVKEIGASKVVFSCPSCYLMWKKFYSKELPDVHFLHEVEYLDECIQQDKVKLNNLNMKATYHDPCDLGRKLHVFEPPRNVIKSIPGVDFQELPHNREDAWCCGGGGDVEIADESLPGKVAKLTFDEVDSLKADTLITACGACKRTFLNAKRKYGKEFRVIDIAELVLDSINGKS